MSLHVLTDIKSLVSNNVSFHFDNIAIFLTLFVSFDPQEITLTLRTIFKVEWLVHEQHGAVMVFSLIFREYAMYLYIYILFSHVTCIVQSGI